MRVYRLFRHRKYGEPLTGPIMKQIPLIPQPILSPDTNAEKLDTVVEEEENAQDYDSDTSVVNNASELEEFLYSLIEG